MNRNTGLYALVGLVALATLLIYFFYTFERVTKTDPPHWSTAALENRFLAASELLQKEGYAVNDLPSYGGVPTSPGLLFLATSNNGLSEEQAGALLDWVRKGNTLLVEAAPAVPGQQRLPDALLDPLGIRLLDKTRPQAASTPTLPPRDPRVPPPLTLSTPDGDLSTTFNPAWTLTPPPDNTTELMAADEGPHVVSMALGQGQLTVLSDSAVFSNTAIDSADNAALLSYLVHRQLPTGTVWIVFAGHYPTLFDLIWLHAWPLVLSAALFLACWLWWSSRRFGPLLPGIVSPRRQLSEHLRACGRYLWYAGQQARLYKALRRSLVQRMLRRHPQWRRLSNNELLTALATHSGLGEDALRRALTDPPSHELARFLTDVRVLNQLRKQL